jgi:hypothetical protein
MRAPSSPTLVRGVAAGAAGTAALNAITYLDMALRGRPSSVTPQQTVEKVAGELGVSIPGSGEERGNRTEGLGSLMGLLTGVGSGLVLSIMGERIRARGRRLSFGPSAATAALVALLAGNGPMTALGITDPREWPLSSWAADVIPHLGYGLAAAWVLTAG